MTFDYGLGIVQVELDTSDTKFIGLTLHCYVTVRSLWLEASRQGPI